MKLFPVETFQDKLSFLCFSLTKTRFFMFLQYVSEVIMFLEGDDKPWLLHECLAPPPYVFASERQFRPYFRVVDLPEKGTSNLVTDGISTTKVFIDHYMSRKYAYPVFSNHLKIFWNRNRRRLCYRDSPWLKLLHVCMYPQIICFKYWCPTISVAQYDLVKWRRCASKENALEILYIYIYIYIYYSRFYWLRVWTQ